MPVSAETRRRLRLAIALGSGVLALALLARLVFSVAQSGDYQVGRLVGGDNAGPGMAALLHGSVSGYLAHQPIIGLTSILLRLPVAWVAHISGVGGLALYQWGALACMMPLALLAAWLACRPGLAAHQRVLRLLAVVIVIEGPVLSQELAMGHPEGTVAGVLALAAVIAATQGRARTAAVTLGLAIGAKEWAAMAIVPALLALPGQRRKLIAIAAGVVAVMCCSIWLADPAALMRAMHGEGAATFMNPLSLLWPLGSPVHLRGGPVVDVHVIPFGLTRAGATLLTLGLVTPAFVGWLLRARRRGATADPLALLALLGVLRCVVDSTHLEYYWIAALIPLAGWEAIENRAPIVTALTSLGLGLLYAAAGHVPSGELYLVSLAGKLILVAYLAQRAMRRPAGVEATGYVADTRPGRARPQTA